MRVFATFAVALAVGHASVARASDEAFELWLNPAVEADIGRGTVELESAHRFRDGRDDTHYLRLWYGQSIGKSVALAAGIEQRFTGSVGEKRLLQQLSYRSGVFRGRTRIEQRFVENDERMGLRLRQRVGISVLLGRSNRIALVANAEGFVTMRATTSAGQTGLTGLRTIIGFDYKLNDRIDINAGYLRAQDFRRGGIDRVGHAPLLGMTVSL